jgi:hypothetical protein
LSGSIRIMRISRCICFLVLASTLVACAGCSKDEGRIAVYPVSGRILVRGAPAAGAQVIFYPVSEELRKPGMPIPEAMTDANGEYQLRSYEPNDGAPAGQFNVTILWAPAGATGGDKDSGGGGSTDRLGNRYLDPKKSGLTATVSEGGGEIPPFELH